MAVYFKHDYEHLTDLVLTSQTVTFTKISESDAANPIVVIGDDTEPANVQTYTPHASEVPATDYTVAVDGNSVFVYDRLGSSVSTEPVGKFAYFDFDTGMCTVVVTTTFDVVECVVRPLSKGIVPVLSGTGNRTITFQLDPATAPANLSVECDNDLDNPLFIFAGAIESLPAVGDTSVYFRYLQGVTYSKPASGTVNGITSAGEILIPANKKIVVEGGAIVKAKVRMGSSSSGTAGYANAHVVGRGIVDATSIQTGTNSDGTPSYGRSFKAYKMTDASIDGVIMLNRQTWGFRLFQCNNFIARNVKILSGTQPTFSTSDGCDILGANNVELDGLFIRSPDDGIAIKNEKSNTDGTWAGDVEAVHIHDCVIWQGGQGNALEIGWETGGYVSGPTTTYTVHDVNYENIDIIHKTVRASDPTANHRSAMGIHNYGAAGDVSNVRYTNVRVEDCEFRYVTIFHNDKNSVTDDVIYTDCNVLDTRGGPSLIDGTNSTHKVTNVTFNNFVIDGVLITNANFDTTGAFVVDSSTTATIGFGATGGANPALLPTADAYVQNGGTALTGADHPRTGTHLLVKNSTSASVTRQTLLKFDASGAGGSCAEAILRVYCLSKDVPATTVAVSVYQVTDDTWTEAAVTWPGPTRGSLISAQNITSTGAWYEWDVTAYVNTQLALNGITSFALWDAGQLNNKVVFASRESTNMPQLAITP